VDFPQLSAIKGPLPIAALDEAGLKELQTALAVLGYPVGAIDGMLGVRTRTAWAEFKSDVHRGNPDLIGPDSFQVLKAKTQTTSGYDFSTKTGTLNAIRAECIKQGIGLDAQVAYVFATVQWETNSTFAPVREAYWLSEEWRKENLAYYPWYGRGYVQLTWKSNYSFYGQLLGIDLVTAPDEALQANIALFVLVHGFKTGSFTGRAITDYIDSHQADFVDARRCINGTDRAYEIASLAEGYLRGSITVE